jgi:hypothetical protein
VESPRSWAGTAVDDRQVNQVPLRTPGIATEIGFDFTWWPVAAELVDPVLAAPTPKPRWSGRTTRSPSTATGRHLRHWGRSPLASAKLTSSLDV